jgi:BirA family transcriptional regulator, biotin operon repressor / biotin---[acetyl-CoA-carboxylase] ligase
MVLMPNFTIHRVDRTDSTNSQLLQWAGGSNCHRVVLVADEQTAGRGQRGRRWYATAGQALLCSVAWRFAARCPLDGLSLAVGVMVAQALDGLRAYTPTTRLSLKWPNDLLIDGTYKLGGILIESLASEEGSRTAVIGIGINLGKPEFVAVADALPGIGLNEWLASVHHRDEVLDRILNALESGLMRFAGDGFPGFRDQWWSQCAYAGEHVTARLPDGDVISGKLTSVTDRGGLVIESERGLHTLVSGEVSLRVSRP